MAIADSGRNSGIPSMNLSEAIEKVRTLYEEAHRRRMSRVEIAKLLGYTGLNGASVTMISGLGKYGLIEGRGDEIRVSDDAVALLLEPPGSPDRAAAMRRAALRPELFAELAADFDGVALPGENAVKIRLERRGFTPKSAAAAARAFRENMELVSSEGGAYNHPQVASVEEDRGGIMQPETSTGASSGQSPIAKQAASLPPAFMTDLPPVTFPLPRGNALEIRLRSKISQAEFERLKPILMSLLEMAVVEEEDGN